MEEGAIGRRVRYWRERRRLTRVHFADLVGRSPSWVDKVESGERKLDRLSVMEQIATTLNVPLAVLLDDEAFRLRAQCVDPPEIAAIRQVLQQWPGNVASSGHGPDLHGLHKQITYAWLAFQASDYTALGPVLAGLVTETERARADLSTDDDVIAATGLLAQAYQIIASTTRKLGHWDLEWIAAERAMRVAEESGDTILLGGAAFRLVNALRDNAGAEAAVSFACRTADAMAGNADRVEVRSLYGHLLLQGAMAACVQQDTATVSHLLTEAEQTAQALGEDRNDYWTCFGPTNVLNRK